MCVGTDKWSTGKIPSRITSTAPVYRTLRFPFSEVQAGPNDISDPAVTTASNATAHSDVAPFCKVQCRRIALWSSRHASMRPLAFAT